MTVNILVVEDEHEQRELICDILTASGFQVMSADCVEQAILHIKSNKFDVIFSDWKLGELSGLDLLNYVRRNDKTGKYNIIAIQLSTFCVHNKTNVP